MAGGAKGARLYRTTASRHFRRWRFARARRRRGARRGDKTRALSAGYEHFCAWVAIRAIKRHRTSLSTSYATTPSFATVLAHRPSPQLATPRRALCECAPRETVRMTMSCSSIAGVPRTKFLTERRKVPPRVRVCLFLCSRRRVVGVLSSLMSTVTKLRLASELGNLLTRIYSQPKRRRRTTLRVDPDRRFLG